MTIGEYMLFVCMGNMELSGIMFGPYYSLITAKGNQIHLFAEFSVGRKKCFISIVSIISITGGAIRGIINRQRFVINGFSMVMVMMMEWTGTSGYSGVHFSMLIFKIMLPLIHVIYFGFVTYSIRRVFCNNIPRMN